MFGGKRCYRSCRSGGGDLLCTRSLECVATFFEDGRVKMDNNAANAARGICGIMPIPGLCRTRICEWSRFGRISDSCDCETRHNHSPSKNVSSESIGWKRSGTAPDGAACASAFSLSCISAWR